MSEEQKSPQVKVSVDVETWPLAFVVLFIAVVGDPDLIDAAIHYLMK